MKSTELRKQYQVIQNLITTASPAATCNIEVQAHWAKYLCILCAGLLENSIQELFASYIRLRTTREIYNFTYITLSNVQNPKSYKFLEIAGRFSGEWKSKLESFLEAEGRKDAIDSIMANRHLIAHGKNSGITLARLKEYLRKSVEVLEFIEEIQST